MGLMLDQEIVTAAPLEVITSDFIPGKSLSGNNLIQFMAQKSRY